MEKRATQPDRTRKSFPYKSNSKSSCANITSYKPKPSETSHLRHKWTLNKMKRNKIKENNSNLPNDWVAS